MPNAIIYARKSTESEDRQVLSIESQVRELQQYASRTGLEIQKVFTESKSAKSPGRPVFSDVLKKVQAGRIDVLVCWKLDRLARNPVDGGFITWSLEEGQLKKIVTPQREFENSSNDKFWMHLEFGMAKKYVDDLSDNVKRGLRARLEHGWAPSLPPLGYLNDPRERTIIKDPERFSVIRKMWNLMLTGNYTPEEVCEIANHRYGLRTRLSKRRGNKPISVSTAYRIFHSPFYYGAILWHGELYNGQHEPMISRMEYDRIQRLLGADSNKRPQKHTFAFTGMINCGYCGASVTAEIHRKPSGRTYIYYHCTRKKKHLNCKEKMIEVTELEAQIVGYLHSMRIRKGHLDWALKAVDELEEEHSCQSRTAVTSLRKRVTEKKLEIAELLNIKVRKLIEDSEFVQKKNELHTDLARLEGELAAAEEGDRGISWKCRDTLTFAERAEDMFVTGDKEQKRAILRAVGSNLILTNRMLNIQAPEPLRLIRNALVGSAEENCWLEPEKNSERYGNKHTSLNGIPMWYGLVKDIRTWFIRNPNELVDFKRPLGLR